jgi:hypothetical protein
LQLELNGTKLTGKLRADPFEGTFDHGRIEGTVKPNPRTTIELKGTFNGDRIEGAARIIEQNAGQTRTNLARWLETTYTLNAAEVSSVLGTSMVYDIAEVVDPQPHVVAKVPKSALAS